MDCDEVDNVGDDNCEMVVAVSEEEDEDSDEVDGLISLCRLFLAFSSGSSHGILLR